MKFKDLIGQVFGRLTVLGPSHTTHHIYWICHCECGNTKIVVGHHLSGGRIRSCGCLRKDVSTVAKTTHGLQKDPLYTVWGSIKDRCCNPCSRDYPGYGGRGITVCAAWIDFVAFYAWSVANGYKKGLSIERKKNDGNYCPENCKWATVTEQNNNTRSNIKAVYHGRLQPLNPLFCGDSGRRTKVYYRIRKLGWDVDRAVDTP